MQELMWVERNGMYVNPSMISICESYLTEQIAELEAKLANPDWNINPNDPNSIRAFFEAKNIYSEKWEPTSTGLVSTDARSLRLVKSQHEAVAMIMDHRKTAKLLQSYVQTLPAYIRPDGRVHPSILLSNNRSARLAMTAPAMQTIPTRGGDAAFLVKSCFTAEGDNTLVVADYKTLEIYFAALLSGDNGMISVLKGGLDYHLETAKKIGLQAWGLTPEQVVAEFEGGDEDHRGQAKTLNFAVLYGQGPAAVAETIGCSEESAKVLLDSLFRAYPRLKQWINECKAEARDTGYTYSYWGDQVARRRPVLDAGFADRERRGHAERAAFNDRIQSTASDYCLMSVIALGRFFRENKWPARVVLTVHDSIIVECRPDIVAEVVAKMNEIMTSWPSGDLKLRCDFKVGPTWGGVTKYKA